MKKLTLIWLLNVKLRRLPLYKRDVTLQEYKLRLRAIKAEMLTLDSRLRLITKDKTLFLERRFDS